MGLEPGIPKVEGKCKNQNENDIFSYTVLKALLEPRGFFFKPVRSRLVDLANDGEY